MTDDATADETDAGWFCGVDTTDSADGDGSAASEGRDTLTASEGRDASAAARAAVREGSAAAPADWPTRAVESGFAADETDYERRLRAATVSAAREAVRERERADDRQLQHCIRALDDTRRTANELAERVAEWGGSLFDHDPNVSSPDAGIAYAEQLVDRKPAGPAEDHEPAGPTEDHEPAGPAAERVISLAQRVVDLVAEAESLESYVAEHAPAVAPNLSHLAGPTLAARLLSLAGGLESLAKQPSGTLQVLGAEDALFAHLRGDAPSPKHGVIYTHDYVRNTHPAERGSAARALAGKLTIAARIDHYSGDRRPALARELDDRIATIRSRHDGEDHGGSEGGGGSRSGGDSGGGGGSGSDGGTGGGSDD